MSWKTAFQRGVSSFRASEYHDALAHFNEAIQLGCEQFNVYDSRAAVYEQLGNHKASLRDAKKVIDLAPERWQGYARSARLFHDLKKYDSAMKMVDLAINRVKVDDTRRREELVDLKKRVATAQSEVAQRRREHLCKTAYHFGKLPVEIFVLIFQSAVAADHASSVTISHVCPQWRVIALSTPSLWQTLVLSDKHPVRKTQAWVKRCRGSISNLCLQESLSFTDNPYILTGLSSVSWDTLKVCRLQGHFLSPFLSHLYRLGAVHILSQLEEAEIQNHGGCDIEGFLMTFVEAKLQSLTLVGSNDFGGGPWLNIKCLKSLVIRATGPLSVDILVALEANPSLETLVLDCQVFDDTQHLPSPLKMIHLKHLEIHRVNLCRCVVDNILTPSLCILRLCNSDASTMDRILHKYTPRGLPYLNELRLGKCQIFAPSLMSLLAPASSLEILEVSSNTGIMNTVLEGLASQAPGNDDQSTIICPNLKNINLSNCSDLRTGAVMRFVRSRLLPPSQFAERTSTDPTTNQTISQIDTLILDGCPNIEVECLPWLRSKVQFFSCVYMSKKESQRDRKRR